MINPGKARIVDAVDVLNDFIGDFITAVMVSHEYSQQFHLGKLATEQIIPIQRMCLSHLVLAFAKFDEFWKHYHDLIPQEHRDACKSILKSMRERKIKEFRNKCVGHIWDNEKRRPLANSEIMSALYTLAAPDYDSFLGWINTPRGNIYPRTVVSVVEAVRDTLVSIHGILPQDVLNR